jgi:hypothetical protein
MSAHSAPKVVPLASNARRAKRAHQVARKKRDFTIGCRVAQLENLIATLDRHIARGSFNQRFQFSLAASILLHLVVIAFVTFTLPKPATNNNQQLEVVLVNAKSKTKPTKADVQAQHNLDGGGNTDANRRAKSPLPVLCAMMRSRATLP